jgi:hypothetical protein
VQRLPVRLREPVAGERRLQLGVVLECVGDPGLRLAQDVAEQMEVIRVDVMVEVVLAVVLPQLLEPLCT